MATPETMENVEYVRLKDGIGLPALATGYGAFGFNAGAPVARFENGTELPLASAALNDYICIQDQKAQNTNGGTCTAGSWQTRDLNTEVSDVGGHASVATNQITLAAGTYVCKISAPAYATGRHQAILYNVTDATNELIGTSQFNGTSEGHATNESVIVGKFTIVASKVFEVRHKSELTEATYGFGVACNFATEIYTIAEFWKVA